MPSTWVQWQARCRWPREHLGRSPCSQPRLSASPQRCTTGHRHHHRWRFIHAGGRRCPSPFIDLRQTQWAARCRRSTTRVHGPGTWPTSQLESTCSTKCRPSLRPDRYGLIFFSGCFRWTHFLILEKGQSQLLHQSMHTAVFITLLRSFTRYYRSWITKGLHINQPDKNS
jgi:hypothetical protein